MELVAGIWPYIEKAGAASAVLLILAVIWLAKQLESAQVRERDKAKEHLADVKTVTSIVERNTAAMETQAELIKTVMERKQG